MSKRTDRQLKELRRLMPWTWDSRYGALHLVVDIVAVEVGWEVGVTMVGMGMKMEFLWNRWGNVGG